MQDRSNDTNSTLTQQARVFDEQGAIDLENHLKKGEFAEGLLLAEQLFNANRENKNELKAILAKFSVAINKYYFDNFKNFPANLKADRFVRNYLNILDIFNTQFDKKHLQNIIDIANHLSPGELNRLGYQGYSLAAWAIVKDDSFKLLKDLLTKGFNPYDAGTGTNIPFKLIMDKFASLNYLLRGLNSLKPRQTGEGMPESQEIILRAEDIAENIFLKNLYTNKSLPENQEIVITPEDIITILNEGLEEFPDMENAALIKEIRATLQEKDSVTQTANAYLNYIFEQLNPLINKENDILTFVQHPLFNKESIITFKDAFSGQELELPVTEIANISYAGGGKYGYVFAFRYENVIRYTQTLKNEKEEFILDAAGKKQNWVVLKLARPDNSFNMTPEQQHELKNEADLVTHIADNLAKKQINTPKFNLSQGALLQDVSRGVSYEAIISQFEYFAVKENQDGSITPKASDALAFLTLERAKSSHPLLDPGILQIGIMDAMRDSLSAFHDEDYVHLDVALRNFLMSRPVYKDGFIVAHTVKLADFGYSKYLNGNDAVDEARDTGPMRSINSERAKGLQENAELKPGEKATPHANKQADLYAYRTTFYEAIGIDVDKKPEDIVSEFGMETEPADVVSFVIKNGDAVALQRYYQNATKALESIMDENRRHTIQLYLTAFQAYLTTPALPPSEDLALYNQCIKKYFLAVLDEKLGMDLPKDSQTFLIHLNQLVNLPSIKNYPLSENPTDVFSKVIKHCQTLAALDLNHSEALASQDMQDVIRQLKMLITPNEVEVSQEIAESVDKFKIFLDKNIKAIELLLQKEKATISMHDISQVEDYMGLMGRLRDIEMQFKDKQNIPESMQVIKNEIEHLNEKDGLLAKFSKLQEDVRQNTADNIKQTMKENLARYSSLESLAKSKKLTLLEFAEALNIIKSARELPKKYQQLGGAFAEDNVVDYLARNLQEESVVGKSSIWYKLGHEHHLLAKNKFSIIWEEFAPSIPKVDRITNSAVAFVDTLAKTLETLQKSRATQDLQKENVPFINALVNEYQAIEQGFNKKGVSDVKNHEEILTVLMETLPALENARQVCLKHYKKSLTLDEIFALAILNGSTSTKENTEAAGILLNFDINTINQLIKLSQNEKKPSFTLFSQPAMLDKRKRANAIVNTIQITENNFHETLQSLHSQMLAEINNNKKLSDANKILLNYFLEPYRIIMEKSISLPYQYKEVANAADYFRQPEVISALTDMRRNEALFMAFLEKKKIHASVPDLTNHLETIRKDFSQLKVESSHEKEAVKNVLGVLDSLSAVTPYSVYARSTKGIFKSLAPTIRNQQNEAISSFFRRDNNQFNVKLNKIFGKNVTAGNKMLQIADKIYDYALTQDHSVMGLKRSEQSFAILKSFNAANNKHELLASVRQFKEDPSLHVHRNPITQSASEHFNLPTTLVKLLNESENVIAASQKKVRFALEEEKPVAKHKQEPADAMKAIEESFGNITTTIMDLVAQLQQIQRSLDDALQKYSTGVSQPKAVVESDHDLTVKPS